MIPLGMTRLLVVGAGGFSSSAAGERRYVLCSSSAAGVTIAPSLALRAGMGGRCVVEGRFWLWVPLVFLVGHGGPALRCTSDTGVGRYAVSPVG